jgi:protocatechuate 3,4-dioxygenase beta subunit
MKPAAQPLPPLNRRHLLAGSAAAFASLAPAGARAAGPAPGTRAPLPLTAQTTEGPFYLPGMPVRADITEGLPGVPLELQLRVVDPAGQPCGGARVDLWQCDIAGLYSGFGGQGDDRTQDTTGRTFLRGSLDAPADGLVVFRTLYPGWYAGRTTHLHFKVWVQGRHVLTSQIFLPDALSEFLYTQLPAYQRASLRKVLNATDGIAVTAGRTVVGAVREDTDRYVATFTAVIDPQVEVAANRPPRAGESPPGGGARRGSGGPPPGFGGVPALPVPKGADRVQALVPRYPQPTPSKP